MKLLTLFLSSVSILAFAAERPTLPGATEDRVLTQGAPASQFFEARRTNTECRRRLVSAKSLYESEKAELKRLISTGSNAEAIDDQESKTVETRLAYLGVVGECGDCAVREVERRTIFSAGRTETWYISDGSCQLPNRTQQKLTASYEKIVDSLIHLKRYPKRFGGFRNVWEFLSIDSITGKPLSQIDKLEASPSLAFIAVRGPELLTVKTTGSYLAKLDFSAKGEFGKRNFLFSFQGTKPPRGYSAPSVYDYSASGKRAPARQMNLTSVMGMWYVTEGGYLRYFTAADFGLSIKFAADLAKEILLDTVVELSERGVPEEP